MGSTTIALFYLHKYSGRLTKYTRTSRPFFCTAVESIDTENNDKLLSSKRRPYSVMSMIDNTLGIIREMLRNAVLIHRQHRSLYQGATVTSNAVEKRESREQGKATIRAGLAGSQNYCRWHVCCKLDRKKNCFEARIWYVSRWWGYVKANNTAELRWNIPQYFIDVY